MQADGKPLSAKPFLEERQRTAPNAKTKTQQSAEIAGLFVLILVAGARFELATFRL
jgi:hypothetical protein